MTPEARDRFDEMATTFLDKHFFWRGPEHDALLALLRTVARDARSAAMEEAAKVCDVVGRFEREHTPPSQRGLRAWLVAGNCAAKIRALCGDRENR